MISGPLARDVDAVLEDARVEAADRRGLLDVRGRLGDVLDVGARERDLLARDLDLRGAHDARLARRALPEEVLDEERLARHLRLDGEVREADLHLVLVVLLRALHHVADVGAVGSHERALLLARQVRVHDDVLAVLLHRDTLSGEGAGELAVLALHLEGGTGDGHLHALGDVDDFLRFWTDHSVSPQYTYARSFPPVPISFAL